MAMVPVLRLPTETRGAQVLWGRCYEEEGAPPYWPWLQSIRSYIQQQTPDIAEIFPDMRRKLTDLETPLSLEAEQARLRIESGGTNAHGDAFYLPSNTLAASVKNDPSLKCGANSASLTTSQTLSPAWSILPIETET